MTVIIKGITYQVDEGAVITENYNETLDSANIRISHQTTKLNIEPFDRVILVTPMGNKYFCIDTYVETMVSVNPAIYEYEISLFSETKLLEGIILPNLSITQLKTGTKRTIKHYLDQYLNLYGKKYRNGTAFVNKWSYNVGTKFNIECPEMQWNAPTLRAVLTDLMMVADCIPVLKNNVISYIDLTEKKDAVDTSKVNYIRSSQSSSDYVSEIKINMKNVSQTESNNVRNITNVREVRPLYADNYLVDSNNVSFKTKYPIYKIKHFYFGYWAEYSKTGGETGWAFVEKDLCNLQSRYDSQAHSLVKESKEWMTLPIFNKLTDIDWTKVSSVSSYRNSTIYYTRNGNVIENINPTNKLLWWKSEDLIQTYIHLISYYCCDDLHSIDPQFTVDSGETDINNYYRPLIRIEYETMADVTFSAGKTFEATNDRVIVDNQTNSWVDAFSQGLLEYQKVNRLGNQQLMINSVYNSSFNNITKIGDYYGESIIYQCQYQIYKDVVLVNSVACKDYILKDYFTGIKSKVRTWVNAKDEALQREELIKYYCEFSKNRKDEYVTSLTGINMAKKFLFYPDVDLSSEYTTLISTTQNDTEGYFLENSLKLVGNSLVYTLGFEQSDVLFEHTSLLGNSSYFTIIDDDDLPISPHVSKDYIYPDPLHPQQSIGGIPLTPFLYVDSNFEFEYVNIGLSYFYEGATYHGYNTTSSSEVYSRLEKQYNLTKQKAPYSQCFMRILNYPVYKDNREIPIFNIQFEFCSDTKDIVFTKKYLEYQETIRKSPMPNTKVYREQDFASASGTTSVTGIVSTYDEEIEKYYLDGSISISIGELSNPSRFIRNISNVTTSITSETGSISILRKEVVGNEYVIYYRLWADEWRTRVDADINYNYEINSNPVTRYYRIYKGNVSNFDWKNPTLEGAELTDLTLTVTNEGSNYYSAKLTVNTTESLTNKVFYICSENNILIAMKETKEIYLNILKDRDTNIYDSNGNIIGTILIS